MKKAFTLHFVFLRQLFLSLPNSVAMDSLTIQIVPDTGTSLSLCREITFDVIITNNTGGIITDSSNLPISFNFDTVYQPGNQF